MTARNGTVVVLLVLLAALLQSSWLPDLALGAEWPDLTLVTVILVALLCGPEPGLLAGITAGLAMGWLSGCAGGAFLVSRVVTAAGMGQLRELWSRDNRLAQVLAVVAGSIGCEFVFALTWPSVTTQPEWFLRVVQRAVLNAVVALLVAPVVARFTVPVELST